MSTHSPQGPDSSRSGSPPPEEPTTLTSPAFAHMTRIPVTYTGDGRDVSPPLQWAPPSHINVAEWALIVDDPDAPVAEPWVHWVIYAIPGSVRNLWEGIPRQGSLNNPSGAMQGVNTWPSDNIGYRGPAPPKGHGVHHYHFKLYGLSKALPSTSGWTKRQLLDAMAGSIVTQGELIGTYSR